MWDLIYDKVCICFLFKRQHFGLFGKSWSLFGPGKLWFIINWNSFWSCFRILKLLRNLTFFQNMLPISYYILLCNNEFSLWHWVTDPDAGSCTFCQMLLRVTCKNNHCRIPHGSLAILTCLSTCHFGLMTSQLKYKSHCNQCKLGIFSKSLDEWFNHRSAMVSK